jgi:hypothetical protein
MLSLVLNVDFLDAVFFNSERTMTVFRTYYKTSTLKCEVDRSSPPEFR